MAEPAQSTQATMTIFFKLPTEIRKIIWAEVVNLACPHRTRINPIRRNLSILQSLRRTCREIDHDVSLHFFTSTTFVIAGAQVWRARTWLRRIGARNRSLIRFLILQSVNCDWSRDAITWVSSPEAVFVQAEYWATLLQEMPNLCRLQFTQWARHGPQYWDHIFSTQRSRDFLPSHSLCTAICKASDLRTLEIAGIDIRALLSVATLPSLEFLRVERLSATRRYVKKQTGCRFPSLQVLQVGVDSQIAEIYKEKIKKFRKTPIEAPIKGHLLSPLNIEGSTLRFSQVCDAGLGYDMDPFMFSYHRHHVSSDPFGSLVRRCPKAQHLGLSIKKSQIDRIDYLPKSLETITLELPRPIRDQEALTKKIRDFRQRCTRLRSITVFIKWEESRPFPSPASSIDCYKTFIEYLQDLSREGIEVHCIIRTTL